jgi:O-antigen/teichoic acid export membrane protein
VPSPVRNVIANWTAFVFSAVVGFVLSPFIVRSLGDAAYGAWVLIGSTVGYLGLLDLGIRGAVTRYVANLHAGTEHREASLMASAALFIFSIAGAVAIAACVVIALGITRLFAVPDHLQSVAQAVVIILGINIAVTLVSGVYGGVITALQRFDLGSGIGIAIEALRALAVFTTLKLGGGILPLALVQLGCSVLGGTLSFLGSRMLYPELRVPVRGWHRGHVKRLLGFSTYSLVLQVAGMVAVRAYAFVIGAFMHVGTITFYAIAANLIEYARTLVSGISHTITPRVSALERSASISQIARIPVTAGRLAGLVLFPVVTTFLLRGDTFIGLWMGPQYAEHSGRILVLLAIALGFSVGAHVAVSVLMGLHRHRALVPGWIAEAAANVLLSVVLIRPYGLVGVALGAAIPNLLVSVVYMPYVLRRTLGVSPTSIVSEVWLRPAVAMIPFAAATLLIERFWPASSVIQFFLQVASALPVAALGAWFVGLTGAERAMVGRRLLAPFRAHRPQRRPEPLAAEAPRISGRRSARPRRRARTAT